MWLGGQRDAGLVTNRKGDDFVHAYFAPYGNVKRLDLTFDRVVGKMDGCGEEGAFLHRP